MDNKKELKIELITPERVLLDSTITFATIPSGSGPVGVLPNHAPLLGNLFRGVLMVRDISGKEFNVFVQDGDLYLFRNVNGVIEIIIAQGGSGYVETIVDGYEGVIEFGNGDPSIEIIINQSN